MLGVAEQAARQAQQRFVQALRMQGRMAHIVHQRGGGRADRMQQPERRHVARAELDHVAARLAVVAVQRAHFRLQRVEQVFQHALQARRAGDRQAGRHE
ncbi:hypothetical protein D3C71_1795960 [compost metagenome]